MRAFTETQEHQIRGIVDGFQALPAEVWDASMEALRDQGGNPTRNAAAIAAVLATYPQFTDWLRRLLEEVHTTCRIRTWALQQFTEEEIVVGLQEARAQSEPELGELIREIEQGLHNHERSNP